MEFEELEKLVTYWAKNKQLVDKDFAFQQFTKTVEELGEVASALVKNKPEELKDGIGDVVVTLIILAAQKGLTVRECLEHAWEEIQHRKGQTVDGVFIKAES